MRACVIDDEPPARKKVLRLLAAHADVEVAGEAGSGEEAVALLERVSPDVAFLDVQMPDMDGFEVLGRLRGPSRLLPVFVTAHDAYAVRAFDVSAVDYLLKPVDAARFGAMMDRVRAALRAAPRARILVADRQRSYFVDAESIDWIEADRNYVVLHAAGAEHVVRGTLESFLAGLDAQRFVRISRSHAVQRDAVEETRARTHGERELVMRDGATLTWTRRYR